MSRILLLPLAAVSILVLPSCQSQMVSTKPESHIAGAIRGVPYYLPATIVPVTIKGEFVPIAEPEKGDLSKLDESQWEYALSLEMKAPEQVADGNALRLLEYQLEGATDDNFKLAVNDKGLLTTVDLSSTDHSADIAKKAIEFAKEAAKGVVAVAGGLPLPPSTGFSALLQRLQMTMKVAGQEVVQSEDERRIACHRSLKPFVLDAVLPITGSMKADSESSEVNIDVTVLNAKLMDFIFGPEPRVAKPYTPRNEKGEVETPHIIDASFSHFLSQPTSFTPKRSGGVTFRLVRPGSLDIRVNTTRVQSERFKTIIKGKEKEVACILATANKSIEDEPITFVDPYHSFEADVGRTGFVSKRVKLAIADGVLQGTEVDKPSDALAAVSLPVDIVKAIVAIPSELFQFKIRQVQDAQGLTDAQAKYLTAQIELLKQIQALEEQKAKLASPNAAP